MTTKRSGAKRPAKKATKKAVRKTAVVTIPSPVEVLGEVGSTLDERELRFAYAFVAHPIAAKAYRAISPGVADTTARTEGMRMRHRPAVAEFIATLQAEILERYNVTNERIIEEYARIAFLDPADLYDEKGNLLPVWEMPEHARRAIAAIDVDEIEENLGHGIKAVIGHSRKVKLWGKRDALQDLAKIRKMLTDKVELSADASLAALIMATPTVPAP